MAGIMIGNLRVRDIEEQLGIEFTLEDKQLLEETWQQKVMDGMNSVKMPSRSWHFFDIPRNLVFGSFTFFQEFKGMLRNYKLKGSINVSFNYADEEKIENRYSLYNEQGFPNYLYGTENHQYEIDGELHSYNLFSFWQLQKINKKTVVYSPVSHQRFLKEVLGIKEIILHDHLVPKTDDFRNWHLVKLQKEELFNPWKKDVSFMEQVSNSIYELKIWKGENISEDSAWKTDFDFEKLKSNLKEYKKFRKEVKLLN